MPPLDQVPTWAEQLGLADPDRAALVEAAERAYAEHGSASERRLVEDLRATRALLAHAQRHLDGAQAARLELEQTLGQIRDEHRQVVAAAQARIADLEAHLARLQAGHALAQRLSRLGPDAERAVADLIRALSPRDDGATRQPR